MDHEVYAREKRPKQADHHAQGKEKKELSKGQQLLVKYKEDLMQVSP